MESITIRISATDQGGYLYDIYESDAVNEFATPHDGGHCTTTLINALGMAAQQAQAIVIKDKGVECAGCGRDMYKTGKTLSVFHPFFVCISCHECEVLDGDFIGER